MFLIFLTIRKGNNPLLDSLHINFIDNVLKEVNGVDISLMDIQVSIVFLHVSYVTIYHVQHEDVYIQFGGFILYLFG